MIDINARVELTHYLPKQFCRDACISRVMNMPADRKGLRKIVASIPRELQEVIEVPDDN